MTPIEQDKEQRYHLASCEMYETLRGIFPNDRRLTGKSCSCGLKELITADRKRVALEARLDELNAIYGWSQEERTPLIFYPEHRSSDFAQMAANGMGTNFTVRERIYELKQELEKL